MKIELDEKDVYCLCRVLQSLIYVGKYYFGCRFCKYNDECDKEATVHFDDVRRKIGKKTGLYMDKIYNPANPEFYFSQEFK